MAALKGYVGAFYVCSDIGKYSDIVDEAVGTGTGAQTRFPLDQFAVSINDITVKVSDVTQRQWTDYTVTPKGSINFTTAPTLDYAVVASYKHFPVSDMVQTGGFYSWSVDVTVDELDSTVFATNGWRTKVRGLQSWSGTAERHWLDDSFLQLMKGVASDLTLVRFYMDETNSDYLAGWAYLTGISTTVGVDGLADEVLTFTGTGMLGQDAD